MKILNSSTWNLKFQLDATEWFLLQNLSTQHVTGTIMPIIRSSRVIQMVAACGTWALWFTGRWSGVELWVMCPVCGMFLD
jgi:hypothetical protein